MFMFFIHTKFSDHSIDITSQGPIFRFKSLRGQKDGLECAVCSKKFEPTEVLRLLPTCKHAFHLECLDTWLDIHSTCPLCRYQVHQEDVLLVDQFISGKNSSSGETLFGGVQAPPTPPPLLPLSQFRGLRGGRRDDVHVSRPSSPLERGNSSLLEVIVEPPGEGKMKNTTSLDISNELRKDGLLLDSRKNWLLLLDKKKSNNEEIEAEPEHHRLDHMIIIGGPEMDNSFPEERWSDVQSSDMLYLHADMILSKTSILGQEGVINVNDRSVSEMTGLSRFRNEEEQEGHNNGRDKRQSNNVRGALSRWKTWISK